MTAEHRAEQSVLHPAHIELLELRILGCRTRALGVVRAAEESAYVGVEVGIASEREAKSGRNLIAKHLPRRSHIAAPHVRAVVLLSGKCRTGHDEHALAAIVLALRLIDAANGLKWECIAQRAPGAAGYGVLVVALAWIEEVGIGRVHPPGIGAIIV